MTCEQLVLVVEDDEVVRDHLAAGLTGGGWRAETAADGAAGLQLASQTAYDVLVVDRLLPGLDGLSMVRALRRQGVETPAIFLTALGSIAERVEGLDGGGDDYLVKPFSLAELRARVGALARRAQRAPRAVLEAGDVALDRIGRTVRRAGRPVELLAMEYRLLEFLMLHPGRPVTRAMLLEQVWGFNFDPGTNIVETHISRLRAKLGQGGERSIITTIRGAGYVIGAAAADDAR
jgi:two-component system OmpR family response regulator